MVERLAANESINAGVSSPGETAPKVVVFDLGKVLVDFDYSIAARRITSRCLPAPDPASFFSERAGVLEEYELGRLTTGQFFKEVCKASRFSGSEAEFGEFFADIFSEIPPMIQLHADLRKEGYPVFIFSNTNDLAVTHIRSRFPFFKDFDGYILSYEHGSMKPSAALYEVVERETKCRAREILYLDDRPENIAAGARRGWRAVLHETPEKTREACWRIIDGR